MLKQIKHYSNLTPIIITAVFFSLVVSIQSASAYPDAEKTKEQQSSLLSIFSTRTISSYNSTQITQQVDYTITKFNASCPSEVAIYIHGFNKDKDDAGEEFNRIQTSLNKNNYSIPLIGFSWESKVLWPQAKVNAKNSGEELAKFILGFKKENKCPNTDIRIIAHSLGAAVVDSTLSNLDNYLDAKISNNSKIIKTVHLLGAAINNKLIANDTSFGKAIEHLAEKFYNLHSSQDDGLEYNKKVENHEPLGLVGALDVIPPFNYKDTNVTTTIPSISDADGDGNLEECFEDIYKPVLVKGDNHCGYIGFREPFSNSLVDDGAIDKVVIDWINS
jgi:esterase/lipase superfamily enzyme